MPALTALIDRFLREVTTTDDKTSLRSQLGAEAAGTAATAVAAHEADAVAAHPATAILNTPAGDLAAITVQAAINELDTEKQPRTTVLTNTTASFTTADETKLDALAAPLALNFTPTIPNTIILDGIISPAADDVELTRVADSGGFPRWQNGTWDVLNAEGSWAVVNTGGVPYSAGVASTAATPVGLTFVVFAGTGPPSITSNAYPPTGTLGQLATVSHSDDTQTEWGCVDTSPMTWLPRTAGIVLNRTTGQWERTFIADGTIQTEILPNQ